MTKIKEYKGKSKKQYTSFVIDTKQKRHDCFPLIKVYLGTPWFNTQQKERVIQATKALEQNPTVGIIHFPFDYQYKNATVDNNIDNVFGSLEWQVATYQNDLSAMATSDAGVFLYDMDKEDSGSAFEIGYMRALHKPVIMLPFYNKNKKNYEMNLMLARGVTSFIESYKDLKKYNFNHMPSNPVCPLRVF